MLRLLNKVALIALMIVVCGTIVAPSTAVAASCPSGQQLFKGECLSEVVVLADTLVKEGECGHASQARAFLKDHAADKASIDGLMSDFACRLESLVKASPGKVQVKVGVYKIYASAAQGANCQRVQCKEYNPKGGTHGQGCAADLLYNGEHPELGRCNPATNRGNDLCLWVHANAERFGLQFRLMPENGFTRPEPWHIETLGANTDYCPKPSYDKSGTPSDHPVPYSPPVSAIPLPEKRPLLTELSKQGNPFARLADALHLRAASAPADTAFGKNQEAPIVYTVINPEATDYVTSQHLADTARSANMTSSIPRRIEPKTLLATLAQRATQRSYFLEPDALNTSDESINDNRAYSGVGFENTFGQPAPSHTQESPWLQQFRDLMRPFMAFFN